MVQESPADQAVTALAWAEKTLAMPPPPNKTPAADKRTRETSGNTPVQDKHASVEKDTSTDTHYIALVGTSSKLAGNNPERHLCLLTAFAGYAVTMGCTTLTPRGGQGTSLEGRVVAFYGFTKEECMKLVANGDPISFEFEGGVCEYNVEWRTFQLPSGPEPLTDYQARIAYQQDLKDHDWDSKKGLRSKDSVHVIAFLKEEWEFHNVTLKQVKRVFTLMGLIVTDKSRPSTKINDKQIAGT